MCSLLDGPTEDLNLMAPEMPARRACSAPCPVAASTGPPAGAACSLSTPARLDIGDRTEGIGAHTLVWTDDAEAPPWTLHQGGRAFWLSLEA
jgi:hypothetical protein